MDFAEQLKSSVDIVRTVGEYVALKKMGTRWVGLCPFHSEKTPSFGVTPAIRRYKCFGCDAGGDVIKFVQEIESLTFWEACKLLAERNGIPVPAPRERDEQTDLRSALSEMHEIAAQVFRDNLHAPGAADVRAYLNKRGLTQSVAEQFQLGYSERSGQDLLRRLKNRFSPEQMEASGLVGKRDDGSGFYDKFRSRLMFPIHSESGKIIAFGGRAVRAEDEPKYLNSQETAIYQKRSVLYNLHRAKEGIRSSDSAILVEGYMDVIGVYNAGFRGVVASCGTALRPEQVRTIKRHTQNIIVNFDADPAGAKATEKYLQLLIDEGMHTRVLDLEGGLDPDEYIKAHGADRYRQRLERCPGFFLWLADRVRRTHDMTTSDGRMAGYQQVLLPAIKRLGDNLARASVASEVAGYLNIDRALVLSEFRKSSAARAPVPAPASHRVPHEQRVILRSSLADPDVRHMLFSVLREASAVRQYVIWPLLSQMIALHDKEGGFDLERLHQVIDEESNRLLESCLHADDSGEVFTVEQASSWLDRLRSDEERKKLESIKTRLIQAEKSGDFAEAFRLMEEMNTRSKLRVSVPD